MKKHLCISSCLLLGILVSAGSANAAPVKSIEWSVSNVSTDLSGCMAVLVQGLPPSQMPNMPLPSVYREDGKTLLGGGGQINGISFLDMLEHTVSINVSHWGSSTGLNVLNPEYWADAAGNVGSAQISGEGAIGQGEDHNYVPYYLLVFDTGDINTATKYAVIEWEYNPGQPIDVVFGGRPGDPNGNQYVNFDVSNLNWISLNPVAVPEPASLSLLGLGAAALIARRRK
ncbi:MAG: PEP-CTERM sorting domain-containing protein [Phycisphaerales bacterium]|nr:PEP-CTERM sorting domain-containing protein [Phycisphaerales bacterium]